MVDTLVTAGITGFVVAFVATLAFDRRSKRKAADALERATVEARWEA